MDKYAKSLSNAYDKVSERVINSSDHYDHLEALASTIITDGSSVLDAGCGNGYLIERVISKNALHKHVKYAAFDASEKMVNGLKARLTDVQISQEFLPNTSFGDEVFNIIMCSEVLEHVHVPREALKELFRIAAPRGMLVLSVPNGDRIGINDVIKKKKAWQPADDVFYTFSELNMMFREAGWRIVSAETIGWMFPRHASDGVLKKITFRLLEWFFMKMGIFALRRKTTVIAARKDDYLAFGNVN